MSITPRWLSPALISVALASSVVLAPVVSAAPDDPQVDALLQKRIDNPRIGPDVGMIVVDGASGVVVSSYDPDGLFLPASNMKIVTAVDALFTMGAEGKFTTRARVGAVPNEVVLEGGGDPLLTTSDLQEMAKRTAKTLTPGVPVVVRIDNDLFPPNKRGPGWTSGYLPYVVAPIESLARLGDYSPTPSTNAAKVFVAKLKSLGFKATIGEPANADPASTVLAERHSTVEAAVSTMLSHSENNVAEVLFRQVAVASGITPTWDGARQAAEKTLAALGIDAAGMSLLDGSGLSRKDRLSPRFLAVVLRMSKVTNPVPFTTMFEPEAMPVAGQTGTLVTAFGRYVTKHARCAQGQVHAKTGSLFDTIALSGIADTTSGTERVFSMFVNDRPQRYSALSTRQALDGLTATMTGCWN